MKEENIDNRIERIIESVGSKKAAMSQWESERTSTEIKRKIVVKRWRIYGISAANNVVKVILRGIHDYAIKIADDLINKGLTVEIK